MANEKAEFAVKILKEYAEVTGNLPRGTTDISPLEEWLILRLFSVSGSLPDFGIRTFRNVQMASKVELLLKPEHMNSVFTWKQIQDAIMNDDSGNDR